SSLKSSNHMNAKQNRNDLCACGSGKKYKKCCGLKEASQLQTRRSMMSGLQFGGATGNGYKDLTKSVVKVLKTGLPGMPTVSNNEIQPADELEGDPTALLPAQKITKENDASKSLH